ncbi:MAG: hypothetical protein DRP45_03735 [Candidatus Zixiibacteriota bacterium]|nr:MAG: hypothetical protein DRP45_03735 [candidate division Zixibacteria bacterium]
MIAGLVLVGSGMADTTSIKDQPLADSITTRTTIDTLLFVPLRDLSATMQVTSPVDLERHLRQNPTVALFKSMFVPGLGQIGNRRYVKAALIIGLEAWLIGTAVDRAQDTPDARDAYLSAASVSERNGLFFEYDERRKSRNKYIWFAGLTVFVSMFDAYVDAHLSGSPADKRNEKLAFDIGPNESGGMSATLAFKF